MLPLPLLNELSALGGSVVTGKRSNLDSYNVNMIVYLRENLGKVQLDRLIMEDPIEEEEEMRIMGTKKDDDHLSLN
jgi:uncharacterized protein with ATP-grasp and redox domains